MAINISQFTYKDQEFDVLLNKNELSYIFEKNGERYGNLVQIQGVTRRDVVNASCNLLINLIDTYDAVERNTQSGAAAASV